MPGPGGSTLSKRHILFEILLICQKYNGRDVNHCGAYGDRLLGAIGCAGTGSQFGVGADAGVVAGVGAPAGGVFVAATFGLLAPISSRKRSFTSFI